MTSPPASAGEQASMTEMSEALEALRTARRRNRLAQLDWFDAFYKAYVTALVSALAIYAAAGSLGDDPVRGHQLQTLRSTGASYLGLVVAVAVFIGLRSGGRGGPLAFERADVRHVLLSPVDRRDSVRKPALRQLRHAVFIGGAVGGAGGLVAVRRFPHLPAAWVLCGALFGAATAVMAYSVAMIASGRRWSRALTDPMAVLCAAWSGVDAYEHLHTSPFTWLAGTALWPLRWSAWGAVGLGVTLALALAAVALVSGCSLEAAERRSRLIGQLRFAATLQDIRTVMVLQRQLSQEHLRRDPYVRLRSVRRSNDRAGVPRLTVFIVRALRGYLRWPLFRIIRLFFLTAVGGLALCAAWGGTSPLVVVTGLCLWVMALDLTEALAQDNDHSDHLRSMKRVQGWMMVRHLAVPFVALLVFVLIGAIPALLLGDARVVRPLLFPIVLSATLLSLGGAALAVTRKPATPTVQIQTPEIAGLQTLWRVLMPPGLAVLGVAPLLAARRGWTIHHDVNSMLTSMNAIWWISLSCGTWALVWIRYGGELHDNLTAAGARATGGERAVKK